MLVSWDWLNQYVKLDMTPAELAERLMMAGLNHEETHSIDDDFSIHLEVIKEFLGNSWFWLSIPNAWTKIKQGECEIYFTL